MNGQQEELPQGDTMLLGVKMRHAPAEVPPGYGAAAVNARFSNRVAEARHGIVIMPWTNKVTATSAELTPYGRVFGDGEFKDSNGTRWLIIAADGGVYKTRENNGSSSVPLPPGVTVWRDVSFTLAAPGVLLMFRGLPSHVAVWNSEAIYITGQLVKSFSGSIYEQLEGASSGVEPGVTGNWEGSWRLTTEADFVPLIMSDIDVGFRSVVPEANDSTVDDENPDDGTETIPSGTFGLAMQNRVFIPYDDDFVAASDYYNVTRYQPVLEAFRISRGNGQSITALHEIPAQDSQSASSAAMMVGKEQSLAIVSNVRGDLANLTRYGVTDEYGTLSPRSVISVGKDVWFMAYKRGVSSIALTESGKWGGVDLPVSDDIQPLIDRINWNYAEKIHAAKLGNLAYFAVPLDTAEVVKGEIIGQDVYSNLGALELPRLVMGRTYRWVKGNATSINFGAGAVTDSGEYVALSTTATLLGSADTLITSELYPVFKGVCNAVLVYDTTNKAWAGHDEGEMICPRAFRKVDYAGGARLFMVGEDGFISLYEETFQDQVYVYERELRADVMVRSVPNLFNTNFIQVNGGTQVTTNNASSANGPTSIGLIGGLAAVQFRLALGYTGATWSAPDVAEESYFDGSSNAWVRFVPSNGIRPVIVYDTRYLDRVFWGGVESAAIAFSITTRGYALRSKLGRVRVSKLALILKTWDPVYSITATLPGVNSSAGVVTDKSRDRTKYFKPHTRAPWDETNVDDDHATPNREDYSVLVGDEFSPLYLGSGVDFSLMQQTTETYRPPGSARGGHVQFKIASSQGRVELRGVMAETVKTGNRNGVGV